MMTAIANSTKQVVVAKGANGRDKFFCPDCQQPVYPRHRAGWTDHFVHKSNSACKTKLVASLESDEHKLGKQLIFDYLRKVHPPSHEIVTEKTITTVDGRCRKIDVAVIKAGKVVRAHECQLSPICIHQKKDGLLARTLDYHRLGISVTWWLGNQSKTDTVCDFLWDILDEKEQRMWPSSASRGTRLFVPNTNFWIASHTVNHPNTILQKMIKDAEREEENSQDKSQVVSKLVARFLNGVRSQQTPEELQKLDDTLLDICEQSGALEHADIEKARGCTLAEVVILYSQAAFGLFEDEMHCPLNDAAFALMEEIVVLIKDFSWKASLEEVVLLASPCFKVLEALPDEPQVIPSSWFIKEDLAKHLSVETPNKQLEKSTIKSLFKYGNPQTARTFIKEAIANALDQNPAEATTLCAAWEQIQPTLPTIDKDVKPTPLWGEQATEVSLPLSANGNGNGRH